MATFARDQAQVASETFAAEAALDAWMAGRDRGGSRREPSSRRSCASSPRGRICGGSTSATRRSSASTSACTWTPIWRCG